MCHEFRTQGKGRKGHLPSVPGHNSAWSALLVSLLLTGAMADAQRLAAQATPATTPKTLTLRQAVSVALERNHTIQAAGAYSQAVRHGIAIAQASRYPRLDFSEAFTRGNNPVYVFGTLLTQRQFTANDFALGFLNTPLPLDNFRSQFAAAMPLYDAGQTSRRVHDARLDSQAAEQAAERTSQDVIFNVINAYTGELLAREGIRVAQAAVDMSTSDLARAQNRQEQGQGVPSDVLSAKVQLAQAQEDLIRARNALELGRAALNVAMGLSEDAVEEIEGSLTEASFDAGTLSDRQQRALAMRPDYLQATLGTEKAKNQVGAARAEFLPKVNLFASWEEDNQTFAARGGNNWLAGAILSFNLFDGGANRFRLAEARARERQAEAQREQMAAGVRLQVREAFLNLTSAGERVKVSRDSASQAEESLRILRNRYESGLATISDVLQAETMRTAAQKNYLSAVYDYRLAFAALELATGELGPDSKSVGQ